jgi:hypothetical protein
MKNLPWIFGAGKTRFSRRNLNACNCVRPSNYVPTYDSLLLEPILIYQLCVKVLRYTVIYLGENEE